MERLTWVTLAVAISVGAAPGVGYAQAQMPPGTATVTTPVPATKLEAFRPAAGTVVTFGYNDLGTVNGVAVDVRELRDTKGNDVRGVVAQVTQSEYRQEQAFVDADELPELLKGIDALLEVKANPTGYRNFEVRYTTKGELRITAFNSGGKIKFAVEAGRITKAQSFMDEGDLRRLRAYFQAANDQLASPTLHK